MSKDKIIKAAVEVFSENGYHRASMDEIALRAQVAKGTLYYNFPSKSQLFRLIVKEGIEGLMRQTEADLSAPVPMNEKIKLIIRHHLDLFFDSRPFTHIVLNEISNGIDQDVLEELRELRRTHLRFLASLLEDGIQEGLIRVVDAHLAAASIVGMIESSCNYEFTNNRYSRQELELFLYTMITQGLFISLA